MTLSKRALDFLYKSKRETPLLTEDDIRQLLIANGIPVFEPLIDFQLKFGGYIFYAGLAPIKFSLLKGEGGFPKSTGTAIIEFEDSDLTSPKYFFDCATTNYQIQFFLDEHGIYYEDYEPKASSFGKLIEHLAIWDEVGVQEYELICRDRRLQKNDIEAEFGVNLVPEASDQYTLWFSNEDIYMQQ